jgi:hypothetical protein
MWGAAVQAQQFDASPLVIDLDGKNFEGGFTDVRGGITFDFFHVGEAVEIAWTEPDRNIGFLVLNRHGDKLPANAEQATQMWSEMLKRWRKQIQAGINSPEESPSFHVVSSREMFGNLTHQPLSREQAAESEALATRGEPWQPNGFRALEFFDRKENGGNGNGVIDEGDFIYPHLRIWVDTAHNGRSEDGKMYKLSDLGIKYISLKYSSSERVDQHGNRLRYVSKVGMADGKTLDVYDVFFCLIRSAPANH